MIWKDGNCCDLILQAVVILDKKLKIFIVIFFNFNFFFYKVSSNLIFHSALAFQGYQICYISLNIKNLNI